MAVTGQRSGEWAVLTVRCGTWSTYVTRSKRAAELAARARRTEGVYDVVEIVPPPSGSCSVRRKRK